MKITCLILTLAGMLSLLSCSGLGDQELSGLNIQTTSRQYSVTSTVHFKVINAAETEFEIIACNLKLTYWLETLDGNTWRDHSAINIGPCLAIYANYVILPPEQSLPEQLSLTILSAVVPGMYRIKIEYQILGESKIQYAFSNSFELIN